MSPVGMPAWFNILWSMKGVVEVIPQVTKDYEPNLRLLKPDYMVHGTDWRQGPLAQVRQKAIDTMAESYSSPSLTSSSSVTVFWELSQTITDAPSFRAFSIYL